MTDATSDDAHDGADWTDVVAGLRAGDRDTVAAFCRAYGGALERLARSHMASVLRQRVGADDVVQSVYRTFLRRAGAGELVLDDAGDLWRLLCAITLTKVREQARFHFRKKRGVDREVALESGSDGGMAHADATASPEQQHELVTLFEALIAGLDPEDRAIVVLKLDGHTNLEIADQVGCSERTVRRLLTRLRARFDQLLAGV